MRHAMKLTACLALLSSAASWALVPPKPGPVSLASKAFFKPELYLPIINTPLKEAQEKMTAQSAGAWNDFFARNGKNFNVYLDTRTGSVSSIEGVIPMIPGKGTGNTVTLASLKQQLGRGVSEVDAAVVGDLVVKFIAENQAAIGVDPLQLGEPKVTAVTENLWQVHIPQQVNGVPVRDARVAATINNGNLILLGTEAWANVKLPTTKAALKSEQAMAAAGDYLGLYETPGKLWEQPALAIVPMVRTDLQDGQTFTGALGGGYTHKLVWTYGFRRDGEGERWRVSVDAQTGEMVAMEDENHYFDAKITGAIYPSTNTEICPNDATCGSIQPGSPMPWADTGMAAPNNFTDSAGIVDYPGTGTVSTTLNGKYVKITDTCGTPSFSSATGNIDMGGVNGNHDCVTGGGGTGNTAAARSCFYETNKLKEQARGWLPTNTWLQAQMTANVNIASTCNAFWDGATVNFYKSGGGCRNTGEIGAVFDHEWGHGIDNFDANATLSNSSEGYADIAANYRLQTSCVGHGFFQTINNSCGQTADGTGFNVNEAQTGTAVCATDCSGVRDSDYAKHLPATPQTPANFVCTSCSSGTGPCGKQVHCAAGPTRQAAWDFVARDLRAAPFNYDAQTAFLVGNKIFYQGSGNVGTWHGCNCTASTSDGCGATNGYMQWLAADDDDGNLANGTPHMTAIYAAFNRHGMACSTPAPVNSGCTTGAPATMPIVSATPGQGQVALNWGEVAGASKYWVMKTEGFAGCNFGKALVANVTGTTYTDDAVMNGRQYCYSVVAAGSNAACFTQSSSCTCVTPACTPPGESPIAAGPSEGTTGVEFFAPLDWSDVEGTKYEVQVATDASFNTIVRSAQGLSTSDWTVTPALPATTQYYWRARAITQCGGASAWSTPATFTTRACIALAVPSGTAPADGSTGVSSQPSLDWNDVPMAAEYEVQVSVDPSFASTVASSTTLTSSNFTLPTGLIPNTTYYWRTRAKDVCGPSAYVTSSFTTSNVCAPSAATFSANLKTPSCGASSCGCDSGTLLRGRGRMTGGFEVNASNVLGGGCADGNSGTYHADESIDKIAIKTLDRSVIAPGSAVKLDVTVWCQGTTDRVDLYYTTNAASPTWAPLTTSIPCTAAGAKTFSQTFNVGATGGLHAVRAQIRYGGLLTTCTSGNYNERDDLAFTVVAPLAQTAPKAPATQGRSTLGR